MFLTYILQGGHGHVEQHRQSIHPSRIGSAKARMKRLMFMRT